MRLSGRSVTGIALTALGLGLAPSGMAGSANTVNPWAGFKSPSQGAARSVGKYSAGCVLGAQALPQNGFGFQLMRPSRQRNFGHPVLISFVQDLSRRANSEKLGTLLIGDLGQPRGGPAPSGHSSHQSGLDVDIWFWRPAKADRRHLSGRERERLSPRAMVDVRTKRPTKHWSSRVREVLRLAATDARVARIFVNPAIKRELCSSRVDGDEDWLGKLRPWWGHHQHFHVRLQCPPGSSECEAQAPIPAGHGCGELDWWFREQDASDRNKGRKRYSSKVGARPELPRLCTDLITR